MIPRKIVLLLKPSSIIVNVKAIVMITAVKQRNYPIVANWYIDKMNEFRLWLCVILHCVTQVNPS